VPATLSIADATATEAGTVYGYTDAFVAPDVYGLASSRVIHGGPDENVYVARRRRGNRKKTPGPVIRSAPASCLEG
jgi:hypothetical protein